MALETMAARKKVAEHCFLDGITRCEETKTCEECIEHEVKWGTRWCGSRQNPSEDCPEPVSGLFRGE